MNCKKAQKYLAAYVDGELRGWWHRRAFLKHLEKCVFCQKTVEMQKQIKWLLKSKVQRFKAPEELMNRIRQKINASLNQIEGS
jgi:anti-sigma factor (TIGR02949 family)